MSHFTVLVISEKNLSDPKILGDILQPYHEYECTGIDDEYVIDVDVTEETKEAFAKHADGETDIIKFAKEWHGAKAVQGDDGNSTKFVTRTNPNAKWDWWQLGGRFNEKLLAKDPRAAKRGSKSFLDTDPVGEGFDLLQRSNLDLDKMRDNAGSKAADKYDAMNLAVGNTDRTYTPWDILREAMTAAGRPIDEAREKFHAQPIVQVLSKAGFLSFWSGDQDIQDYLAGRDHMIQLAREGVGVFYAVLKGGQWYQRGQMGWFGMSLDEKDRGEWRRECAKLLDETPGDHWLAVVDCHI